jgi:hypothetical protein
MTKTNKTKAQYTTTPVSSQFSNSPTYVENFLRQLNNGRWTRHDQFQNYTPEMMEFVNRNRWAHHLETAYNDGRVTARGAYYVYAKKTDDMPKGACAAIYLQTANAGDVLVAWLHREGAF